MADSINIEEFDPPLTPVQAEQVQEVINEALRRRVAEEAAPPVDPFLATRATILKPTEDKPWRVEVIDVSDNILGWVPLHEQHIDALVKATTVDAHQDLRLYKVGDRVTADKNGDWLPGVVTSIEAGGTVNVDTERGPVAVGGRLRIKKAS